MADLPISSLPEATTTAPGDPLAVVVGGTTSKASVNTILTTFSSNSTKPANDLSDEIMIYDGNLLKSTVQSLLESFTTLTLQSVVDTSAEVMIYEGSLLRTTVNSILQSFVSYSNKTTLALTDQVMIYDGSMMKTTINSILYAFTSSSEVTTPDLSDELMLNSGSLSRVTITNILQSFTQYITKSGLSGDEEVMIFDPAASAMRKTTIDEIIGSIISPTHYVYYGIETNSSDGNYRVRNIGTSGNFEFTFSFPTDLTVINEVNLIAEANNFSNPVGVSMTLNSSYGNADSGQLVNQVNGSININVPFPAVNQIVKIPIISAFSTISGASRDAEAGDLAGLMVVHNGIGGTVNYYMLELIYEGPGGSGSTVLVIDNLTSTSTTDALSANQGRVLNENKQDIATLQTSIESLNFNNLTVIDSPVNATDVVNKNYVDSNFSNVSVIDNLTSTSATDALSANQGRILDINKQDISTLQSDIEALNFNTLTVVDAPVNLTDAVNKEYVDNLTPVTVVDNLTSTSATDALSANQGRVLNVTKQNISTLQTSIQSLNFDSLTVINAPTNTNDVANKAYVDSNSNPIAVIDNLTSTSASDALSANQGRILNNIKQDISTLQSAIEPISFNSLTVLNVPTSATDVANKDYVDNSSGGITVIDNLTSTSSTDALSANQGRILNINKQDISTLQSDIEDLNFSTLTVVDTPVNFSDATNKAYVDSVANPITVVDNLTSLSATDALSANQGRVLNENKQEISTLQTDIEALSFSGLIVVDNPTNADDVTNKAYVDANDVTVINNLISTDVTAALSANQGRILNENKQEISTLQTDIEALNFDSLSVINSPVNPTDVTNKNYVDTAIGLKQYWIPVPNPQDFTGTTPPQPIPPVYRIDDSNTIVRLSFLLPIDYETLNAAQIWYTRPQSTSMGATSTIALSFNGGSVNQQANDVSNVSPMNINLDTTGAVNNLKILDVSSLFTDFVADDLITFLIIHITGSAAIDIIGIKLIYE